MAFRYVPLALALAALVVASAFCAGKREGRKGLKLEQNTEALAVNAVVVKADSARIDTAAARTAIAKKASTAARAERAPVAARVAVVSDSQVSIDSGPPVNVPPAVIQLIGLDAKVQRADSVTNLRLSLENEALRIANAGLRERVQLLEERVELVEPGRCGMKCGAAMGAGVVLAVVGVIASLVR